MGSCFQCDWSVETVNTPAQASRAFLEAGTLTWRPTSSTPLRSFSDSGCTARTTSSLRFLLRMLETPQ